MLDTDDREARDLMAKRPGAASQEARPSERLCRVCGCTEDNACLHPNGRPCSWAGPDLCSVCAASIADLMLAVGLADTDAERLLATAIAVEAGRTGMAAPEYRRLVNARRR